MTIIIQQDNNSQRIWSLLKIVKLETVDIERRKFIANMKEHK